MIIPFPYDDNKIVDALYGQLQNEHADRMERQERDRIYLERLEESRKKIREECYGTSR